MILKPDPINKSFIKVFYHDSSTGVWFNKDEILYAKSNYKLNLFGNITEKYKINGYFEFIIDYGTAQISWKQAKNIKDTVATDTKQSIGFVDNGVSNFNGIMRSDVTDKALYDGMKTSGYWWFCLGALKNNYNDNSFPGIYSTSLRVKKVTVWMRANQKIYARTCKHNSHSSCFVLYLICILTVSTQ